MRLRALLLLQRFNGYFLEEHDVVVAMVLQTEITEVGPWTALRFEVKLALRDRVAVLVVRNFHAVQHDDGARAVQRDVHGVPLGPRFPSFSHRLRQRIQHAGGMVFIFFRGLRMVIDLYFKAVVHWHPLFPRLEGNADEYAGIVVFIAHLVDDVDGAVADLAASPVEQSHAAMSADQAIFYGVAARAHVLP